jgi:8-oxo-dGTP pyrophosphatase MutT (NUDIX family)/SAM-dependent methyltransferase
VSRDELQRQSLEAALGDLALARAEFDDVSGWLAAAGASPVDPLAAEAWVFDPDLTQVLLVLHPWRGWVPPGGKVEFGETPREAARRELFEETGLEAELLARPAAASVRSYHPDHAATLGLSYAAIVDPAAPLVAEPGQPVAWMNLDHQWESCFSDDPSRIRQHAQWLRETAMFCAVAAADDSQQATSSQLNSPGDPSQAWPDLAPDYERARSREDSLDRLVEWPAQRHLLGDVTGRSVLDVGCGNGGKLAELVGDGATAAVGVDVSGNFLSAPPAGLELIQGDLNRLHSIPELAGRTFDRILFLQSFGYAKDPVRTLQAARAMLADDGFIVLTRTQPIRYAVERAEQNGTSLGEEYFAQTSYTYRTGWNEQIALTKRTYTISDLINAFSAAGLWIETAIEPQLSEDARRRYPHKQEWMNKYLGILIFKLRPHPGRQPHL